MNAFGRYSNERAAFERRLLWGIVIGMMLSLAGLSYAGRVTLDTAAAERARAVNAAKAKVPSADKTYASLQAEYVAAKNTAEKDAVVKKLFEKLAGVETVEKEQKEKAKEASAAAASGGVK
jgi:hypothetical protein